MDCLILTLTSLVKWCFDFICDKNKLQAELTRIKDLIAWYGFSKRIGDVINNNKLKGLNGDNIKNTTNNEFETIWIKIPNLVDKGD